MTNLKVGMYVRCPNEDIVKYCREYLFGQITNVDEEFDKITVRFYADKNLSEFCSLPVSKVFDAKQLVRCNITENEIVKIKPFYKDCRVFSVISNSNKDDYREYSVLLENENKIIREDELVAFVNQGYYNPIYQMLRYEFYNPNIYKARSTVSEAVTKISNAPYGFENLLSTRTYLYNHQVDTIIRALTSNKCRYMLASEVGMGKTIEACTIIKGLNAKYKNFTALFVVPDSLIYQWQNELSSKFWFDVPIYGKDKKTDKMLDFVVNVVGVKLDKPLTKKDLLKDCTIDSKFALISLEEFSKLNKSHHLKTRKWDMVVVDETHRLLNNKDLYEQILDLTERVKHVLLLSATPITKMKSEYHKLLKLLNSDRYLNMNPDEFDELIEKQEVIKNIVFEMMSDLPDYVSYNLYDEFMGKFNYVQDLIKDEKFLKILNNIDSNAEDKGLSQIKLALSYLAEFYQIDQNIIRHRKKELLEQNILRTSKQLLYEMQGSDVGIHEFNVYESIMSYLEYLILTNKNSIKIVDYCKYLLTAVFSGPNALLNVLKHRNSNDLEEINKIDELKQIIKLWVSDITKKSYLEGHTRDNLLLNYLNKSQSKKIIIFTGFAETAEHIENLILKKFGVETVASFHLNKSRELSQEAANKFQNEENCRFIICDESGGEGRNFQIADEIIHYDLPLSPFQLEQRIGRLDRIGRKSGKDVLSVVLNSNNTIELDIFKLFNEGLNIFNESLCGMEIVFEDIQNIINNALIEDVKFGLSNALGDIKSMFSKMKEEVEKERYFDLAKQFDSNKMEIYNNLINYFTKDDGEVMIDTMLSWAKIAGFHGIRKDKNYDENLVFTIDTDTRKSFDIASAQNVLYFPPKMNDIIQRSKFKDLIYGTFSRDVALSHEYLAFFAPGNTMYDGIVDNAMRCYKGRCTAVKSLSSKYERKLFRLIYNVKFNAELLVKNNISLNLIDLIKQYILSSQVKMYYDIESHELIYDSELIDEVENAFNEHKFMNLGSRKSELYAKFLIKNQFVDWKVSVEDSYRKSKVKARELASAYIKKEYAINQLDNKFNSIFARKIYYNEENDYLEYTEEALKVLKQMLEEPVVELDSVAYIKFDIHLENQE